MESFKPLAKEYDEKFEAFQEELRKWEETAERIKDVTFQRIQAENEFPELKKEREDRERWARAEKIRGDDEKHMLNKKRQKIKFV
uniref:DUF1351 domain-containing protein n=1 Tax=Caenorhabditis tropicalis TaxID=1561998 RepID=A0A1I7T950_9PELO